MRADEAVTQPSLVLVHAHPDDESIGGEGRPLLPCAPSRAGHSCTCWNLAVSNVTGYEKYS